MLLVGENVFVRFLGARFSGLSTSIDVPTMDLPRKAVDAVVTEETGGGDGGRIIIINFYNA